MRKDLSEQVGNRKKFSATLGKVGKKLSFKGYSEETILLKNIIDLETNKVVADHVWFTYTPTFVKAALSPGDKLEFEARVKEYRKGYVNRSYKINHRATDYKLSNPTRIKRVSL